MTTTGTSEKRHAAWRGRDRTPDLSMVGSMRMYVLPSTNLRDIVERRLKQKYPLINYVHKWRDTNGYGLTVARSQAWE
jgi:hypothetical protein